MSGGKKGARLGQAREFLEELGLIGFDGQEVVGLFVLDQETGGFLLGMEGVQSDEGAAQIQVGQEVLEGGDLVGFGGDLELAADHSSLEVQAGEEGEGVAVDLGGGAGALAVDGQSRDLQVLEMGAEPVADQGVELIGVQALEGAADGGFAGREVLTGLAAVGGTQGAELVLVEGLGELTDGQQIVIASDR